MNKKERMNEQIRKHGENLNKVFGLNEDPIKLAKKLHTIELKAHKLATDYCNGENGVDSENWETLSDAILEKVDKVLNFTAQEIPVFVNGDARGYALKINDDYVRNNGLEIHKDWGGYGILAPEFDGRE
jgi:SMC interacting uncharacterized protein involved in chromosome segregation